MAESTSPLTPSVVPTPEIAADSEAANAEATPLVTGASPPTPKERALAFFQRWGDTAKSLVLSLSNKASGGSATATTNFIEGMAVEARFKGKDNFFPGTIKKKNRDGTFDIDYEDGEQEMFVAADLIRDPLTNLEASKVDVLVVSSDNPTAEEAAKLEAAQKKNEAEAAAAGLTAKKKAEAEAAQQKAIEATAAAGAATNPADKERLNKVAAVAVLKAESLMLEAQKPVSAAEVAEEQKKASQESNNKCVRWCRLVLFPLVKKAATPSEATKLELLKLSQKVPTAPRSRSHALVLLDSKLNVCVPHW